MAPVGPVGEVSVVAGPGDEMTGDAARRGRMRASHADREQVIEVLKDAFVQGRLTQDELDTRAGQAFAARTYAELAAVIDRKSVVQGKSGDLGGRRIIKNK